MLAFRHAEPERSWILQNLSLQMPLTGRSTHNDLHIFRCGLEMTRDCPLAFALASSAVPGSMPSSPIQLATDIRMPLVNRSGPSRGLPEKRENCMSTVCMSRTKAVSWNAPVSAAFLRGASECRCRWLSEFLGGTGPAKYSQRAVFCRFLFSDRASLTVRP